MTKKKLSGQTITIIILAILLLVTVIFGGVYAYYSQKSTQVQGMIKMANLNIEMKASGSSSSDIILNTNAVYVPGQNLQNTALTVTNTSNTNIYLVVVYSVKAIKYDEHNNRVGEITDYDFKNPVIDIADNIDATGKKKWEDFRFQDSTNNTDFRYLIIADPIAPPVEGQSNVIDVIPEGKLMLSRELGNNYQACTITLTFSAYCIGSDSLQDEINRNLGSNPTTEAKCNYIMNTIYQAFSRQIGHETD